MSNEMQSDAVVTANGMINLVVPIRGRQVEKAQRGIQSIEVGGELLRVLVHTQQPMALRDLAREAHMSAAKSHRYLVSFVKLGLVKQDPATGAYELGPFAVQLGLVSLQRLEPVREAGPEAASLAARIGHTVFLSVRGQLGPTVVRMDESGLPLHVNMRTGTVMSLMNTATGLVFASFLPAKMLESMLQHESIRMGGGGAGDAAALKRFEHAMSETRRRGLARVVGTPIPGVNALAAPIFEANGNIVLTMTAMGPTGTFDAAWDGEIANALRLASSAVSSRLGFPSATITPPPITAVRERRKGN
jgi:DNA-binding IclR family transcriptional regulator